MSLDYPLAARRLLTVVLAVFVTSVYSAPFVYVAQLTAGSVAIIDAATNTITATIPVGTDVNGLVINRSATRGYALNGTANTVSFIDLVSHNVQATLPWPTQPRVLALSADETKLYIVDAGTTVKLWVLDIASKATIATVALPSYATAMTLDPGGKKLYVLHNTDGKVSVIDLTSNTLVATLTNDPGLQGFDIAAVTSSGMELYVANPAGCCGYATPPSANIVTVIDAQGSASLGRINLGEQPVRLTYAPQTNRVYVAANSRVVAIDPATRATVASIPIPLGPYGMAYLPEFNRLYVTNYWSNAITVIDVTSASVLTTIPMSGPGQIAVAQASAPTNYQGLWWVPNGAESGWGINIAHQADTIVATWFTYGDPYGQDHSRGMWLVMTAPKAASNTYAGKLYYTRGSAFNAVPFDSSKILTYVPSWDGELHFDDAGNGTFTFTISDFLFGLPLTVTKAITRQVFGPLPVCVFGAQPDLALATNYTDLWWAAPAASETGWGINLTHQGDTIFATWFTYDLDGSQMWLVATAQKTALGIYTGTLYRTAGPPYFTPTFDPAKVIATAVGSMTLTFANGNSASFGYTVNTTGGAVTQTKQITREVFVAPGTVCQ